MPPVRLCVQGFYFIGNRTSYLASSKHADSAFERRQNKIRRKTDMAILKDKKVIIIGDRDGIPGPAIEECVKTAGAEVVYSSTECFV